MTGIPYLTKAVNYVVGCDPVSDGCAHCWARRVATTRQRRLYGTEFKVQVFPERLKEMLRWRQPQRAGLSMMGDLFHDSVQDHEIERAFAYAALCQQHTILMFTKRAKRAYKWFVGERLMTPRAQCVATWAEFAGKIVWDGRGSDPAQYATCPGHGNVSNRRVWPGWPLPNVIPVVSVCNQRDADEQLPWLVRIPAARRMVSLEPLLGPIDLTKWLPIEGWSDATKPMGWYYQRRWNHGEPEIHGIIVGCESGPGRRPMDPEWARDLRDQAKAAGISFYLKQLPRGPEDDGPQVIVHPFLDGRQWMEFPEARS